MKKKAKMLVLFGVLCFAFLFCYSAQAASNCVDRDGDGHGFGCRAGLDCNDRDATVYFGAPEIACDGKDNNCNFEVDELEEVIFADKNLKRKIISSLQLGDKVYNTDFCNAIRLELYNEGYDPEDSFIRQLNGIEYAHFVEQLDLGCNRISNIKPLRTLTNLTELDLSQCFAEDGRGLLAVNASSAPVITDIGPLKKLTNLSYLDLSGNMIEDLSPLSNLKKLVYLNLEYNVITDISPLSGLKDLEYLELAYNLIYKIPPLNLPSLFYFGAISNRITNISGFASGFPSLIYIDLCVNNISNLNAFLLNDNIYHPADIDVYENPLTKEACYQAMLLWERKGVEVDTNMCGH